MKNGNRREKKTEKEENQPVSPWYSISNFRISINWMRGACLAFGLWMTWINIHSIPNTSFLVLFTSYGRCWNKCWLEVEIMVCMCVSVLLIGIPLNRDNKQTLTQTTWITCYVLHTVWCMVQSPEWYTHIYYFIWLSMTLEFFTFSYDDYSYICSGIWCTLHMGSPKTAVTCYEDCFNRLA